VATGKPALTHLRTRARYADFALLDVTIETGRTHQIRVHCAFIGHPVAGDALYGGHARGIDLTRQFLHARFLCFRLPGGDPIELESPLAPDLARALRQLEAAG
jgi:23S rRNA-/tRNA-specific pseudouridylate synthase